MANNTFTITVTEDAGVVGVHLEGSGDPKSIAGLTAHVMASMAGKIVPQAVRKVAERGECRCAKCVTKREQECGQLATESAPAATEPIKPTLH